MKLSLLPTKEGSFPWLLHKTLVTNLVNDSNLYRAKLAKNAK